jgi:hypothetical protein
MDARVAATESLPAKRPPTCLLPAHCPYVPGSVAALILEISQLPLGHRCQAALPPCTRVLFGWGMGGPSGGADWRVAQGQATRVLSMLVRRQ